MARDMKAAREQPPQRRAWTLDEIPCSHSSRAEMLQQARMAKKLCRLNVAYSAGRAVDEELDAGA